MPGLAEVLAEETRRAVAKNDLDVALGLVTALAIEAGICDWASISQKLPGGALETIAPTDELVVTADKMQYHLGEGPCVAAVYENDVLTSRDVATDPRWRRWGEEVAALGPRGVLSVHLYTDMDAMGALNLYSARPRDYTDEDRDVARLIGAHASVALAHFRGQAHLWKTIDARHSIGIAQGIVMHQYQMGAEQAFGVLRRLSQDSNTKLHLVAAEVVRAGRLPLAATLPDSARS
jgi:GAF domain-containing protein